MLRCAVCRGRGSTIGISASCVTLCRVLGHVLAGHPTVWMQWNDHFLLLCRRGQLILPIP